MAPKAEWYYHRNGCSGCAKASGFLEAANIEISETVPASRKLQAEDARSLLKGKKKLIAMKGKKVSEFSVGSKISDDMIEAMLGPTGNLRAPLIITGDTCLVGFNQDIFAETFSA